MEALAIAGTVFKVVGALSAASSARDSANYNAALAERNAGIATQQAAADEAQLRRTAAMRQGAARAAYGAAGVTLEGSPLDVLQASASAAEYDALNLRYRGELRSMGYADEAALNKSKAGSAMTAGYINAGAALFGGAGNYYETQINKPKNRAPVEDRNPTPVYQDGF